MSVTIYCSPTHFKMLVGSAKNNSITIDDFHEVPLPEGAMINGIITNEAEMSAFLGQINESAGIGEQETALVIDNNSVRTKLMEVPPVNEQMILDFVKRDLAGSMEEGEEDIFDYAVLSPGGPMGALILAVSASKALIESYNNVFVNAGFKLMTIDIGANSLIKAGGIFQEIGNNTCILCNVDGKAMSISLFEEGVYSITNKYRLLNTEDSDEWYHEIGSNISSVIQFHKGQRGDTAINGAYFTAVSDEQMEKLTSAISYLGIHTSKIDFQHCVTLTGNASAAQGDFNPGKFLYNIGALLRR